MYSFVIIHKINYIGQQPYSHFRCTEPLLVLNKGGKEKEGELDVVLALKIFFRVCFRSRCIPEILAQ